MSRCAALGERSASSARDTTLAALPSRTSNAAFFEVSRTGRQPVDVTALSLLEFVRDLDAEVRRGWSAPTVELVWGLPAEPAPLHTDPMKLKIVLKNLIDNAMKFTDRGSVSVHVTSLTEGYEFVVSDTGIGIAPHLLPIIFEPFAQGDSAQRPSRGVGLGLYVVRRLLEMLGGSVTVESRVGQGTTFQVHVPSLASST